MAKGHNGKRMVDMALGRIVLREGSDHQYIYLREVAGKRGFPIVIGSSEASEIRRVVIGLPTERPLTHQLCFEAIRALGGEVAGVDIVKLENNTFFARLALQSAGGDIIHVDARPSDAIALGLRAGCPLRVNEVVLAMVVDPTQGEPEKDADDEPAADEGDEEDEAGPED